MCAIRSADIHHLRGTLWEGGSHAVIEAAANQAAVWDPQGRGTEHCCSHTAAHTHTLTHAHIHRSTHKGMFTQDCMCAYSTQIRPYSTYTQARAEKLWAIWVSLSHTLCVCVHIHRHTLTHTVHTDSRLWMKQNKGKERKIHNSASLHSPEEAFNHSHLC